MKDISKKRSQGFLNTLKKLDDTEIPSITVEAFYAALLENNYIFVCEEYQNSTKEELWRLAYEMTDCTVIRAVTIMKIDKLELARIRERVKRVASKACSL